MWLKFGPIIAVISCLVCSALSAVAAWNYKATQCELEILKLENQSTESTLFQNIFARKTEWQFVAVQQEVQNEVNQRKTENAESAAAVTVNSNRLRNEVQRDVSKASAASQASAIDREHAATATKLVLYAGLFESARQRAIDLAEEAEAYRVAGEGCSAFYDKALKINNSND